MKYLPTVTRTNINNYKKKVKSYKLSEWILFEISCIFILRNLLNRGILMIAGTKRKVLIKVAKHSRWYRSVTCCKLLFRKLPLSTNDFERLFKVFYSYSVLRGEWRISEVLESFIDDLYLSSEAGYFLFLNI